MSGGKIEDETGKTFLNDIQPLLQALDVLTNFASSAQFASIPAKISDQVCSMSQCSSVLWLKRRCIKLKNSINTGTFAENSILQLISLWMCFCENLCFCRLYVTENLRCSFLLVLHCCALKRMEESSSDILQSSVPSVSATFGPVDKMQDYCGLNLCRCLGCFLLRTLFTIPVACIGFGFLWLCFPVFFCTVLFSRYYHGCSSYSFQASSLFQFICYRVIPRQINQ